MSLIETVSRSLFNDGAIEATVELLNLDPSGEQEPTLRVTLKDLAPVAEKPEVSFVIEGFDDAYHAVEHFIEVFNHLQAKLNAHSGGYGPKPRD